MLGLHASRSQVMSYWPNLNNVVASDQDMSSVGWTNYSKPVHVLGNAKNMDFRLMSKGAAVGADIDALEAAQGKVKLLGVPEAQLTQTSASVAFVAPDGTGCPVDYSRTDPGVIDTFSRAADAGGARARSISLRGLAPGTLYYYRINCAAEQPTGSFKTR